MSSYETRIGSGFDVHALRAHDESSLNAKRTVRLCGVEVPFERYLEGHSDGDVGLHALVDALLGAIGEGDIGMHFPPNDPKWRGADSSRFLLHAQHLLKQKNADIINADITILCERPAIGPYRDAMRQRIAALLHLEPERVNIKATTTEKLGFLGRGEGIAAQAVVAVRLPEKE